MFTSLCTKVKFKNVDMSLDGDSLSSMQEINSDLA